MRTTLDIDEAVLAAARAIARDSNISIGAALSALARRGLAPQQSTQAEDGVPSFDPAPGAAPLTLEIVNAHRDG